MDIRICLMHQLPVWFYAYSTIVVANHASDLSTPNFRRIWFVVLDPTVVRDDQAFWPWFVVVDVSPSLPFCLSLQQANKAIIVASTKRPAYARKKSLTSAGKSYKNAFLSHQVGCCIGVGCVQSASFVICQVVDTRSVICLSRLVVTNCHRPWHCGGKQILLNVAIC